MTIFTCFMVGLQNNACCKLIAAYQLKHQLHWLLQEFCLGNPVLPYFDFLFLVFLIFL